MRCPLLNRTIDIGQTEKLANLSSSIKWTWRDITNIRQTLGKGPHSKKHKTIEAHVFFALKKDSGLWLYIDYQGFNNQTFKNAYLLLCMDNLFDQLQGVTIFSKLDLWSSY